MRIEIECYLGDELLQSESCCDLEKIKCQVKKLFKTFEDKKLKDKIISLLVTDFGFELKKSEEMNENIDLVIDIDINKMYSPH